MKKYYMRNVLLVLCSLLVAAAARSQSDRQGKISLVIRGAGQPVENATVTLVRSKDSALVKVALSRPDGTIEFENISFDTYVIRVSSVNFVNLTSQPFTLHAAAPEISLPALSLQAAASADMKAVTVTARKPFIQKLSDRIVVNVDNSIVSAGTSAFEVLERSPGVSIDPNEVIGLRGKQGGGNYD